MYALHPVLHPLHMGDRSLCSDESDGMHTSERSELDIHLSCTKCLVKYFSTLFESFIKSTVFLFSSAEAYVILKGRKWGLKWLKVSDGRKLWKTKTIFGIINLIVKATIVNFNIRLLLLGKRISLLYHPFTLVHRLLSVLLNGSVCPWCLWTITFKRALDVFNGHSSTFLHAAVIVPKERSLGAWHWLQAVTATGIVQLRLRSWTRRLN